MGNGGSSLSESQRAFVAGQMKKRFEIEAAAGKAEAELQAIMSKFYNELVTSQTQAKPNAKHKSVPRRRSFDNYKYDNHKTKELPPRPPGKVVSPESVIPPVENRLGAVAPLTTATTHDPDYNQDPSVPQEGIELMHLDRIAFMHYSRFMGFRKSSAILPPV